MQLNPEIPNAGAEVSLNSPQLQTDKHSSFCNMCSNPYHSTNQKHYDLIMIGANGASCLFSGSDGSMSVAAIC